MFLKKYDGGVFHVDAITLQKRDYFIAISCQKMCSVAGKNKQPMDNLIGALCNSEF